MRAVVVVARQAKKHAVELNLFKDEASRLDPFHLRTAIISTRVYLILVTVSIIILIVFASLGTESEIITIRNPSHTSYETLLNKKTTSLSCPCSHVTIPYGNFTWTTVDYHPVCSSVFISNDWIYHLFNPDIGRLYQGDFRASASSLFQLLAIFCSYANRSIHDALDYFHTETLLTPNVLLPDSFTAKIQAKSEFLRLSTAKSVYRLLQLLRSITHANGLQTALQTSQILFKQNILDEIILLVQADVRFLYDDFTDCACKSLLNCSMPSGFFNISTIQLQDWILAFTHITPLANVTGFFVGCNPIESLLLSTLECLFDLSCLETIKTFIPSMNTINIYTLNTSQTQFTLNTTIQTMINELYIENWSTNQSFSIYFAQCAPILCTYTSVQQHNALYVLTKLLGIYGGLTAALRLCVPLIITWWRKRRVITWAEAPPSECYISERLEFFDQYE